MAISFAVETVDAMLAPEIQAMMAQHLADVAPLDAWRTLDAGVGMYRQCEAAGMFYVIVARDNGVPVGYSGTFIGPHRFCVGTIFANNDMLFLAPAFRGTNVALRLMRATVAEAKRRGASVMGWAARPDSRFGQMLARSGHVVAESLYLREI